MNISLNWLKRYIDLEGISVEEIEEKLTVSGLEVEEIIDQRKIFDNFVVGYVKEKTKHPNADKLSLCKVDTGDEIFDVVCGAPNVDAGQKIVFAKVGAIVPNGNFEIKKAKIRGQVSMGMICSESELGLSDDHSGIMVLDDSAKVGTPIADYFNKNDVLIEISITPNRADALSHIGVARDLAALLKKPFKVPEITLKETDEDVAKIASVEVENIDACPRYVAKVVKNVEIKESPEWLKNHLISIGLRPINNVVDITNFVLHEIGQPLHAFDLDKLARNKIIVKNAKDGDKFITLDSKERELIATDLMICDAEKPVAIAGVMGGENSEVTETTKNILIESAYFNPSSIRKTAKRLTLSTDASYRFERGCDPNITVWAAERAAALISELAGGEVLKGHIDVYKNKIEPNHVELRYNRITKILGFEVPKEEVNSIFEFLGFKIIESGEEKLNVEVPTFRPDIEREIDLIEEVARIHGFDNIPPVEKINVTLDPKVDESSFAERLREIAIGLGSNEILTNSLLDENIACIFGQPIPVLNPQNKGMTHLRTSLIPGALYTISKNLKVKENSLQLFEIGRTFRKINSEIESFEDFNESENILFALCGVADTKEWFRNERKYDIYDLKGLTELFLEKLDLLNSVKIDLNSKSENFELYFEYKIKKETIGFGGLLKKKVTKKFDIEEDVFVFDFNIDLIKKIRTQEKKFKELLKYPKIVKDFAFLFDKSVKAEEVIKVIENGTSKLLKNVKLFDIFESKNLGDNKKSLAFQLEFYDYSRTLTDDEVEKDFRSAIEAVTKKLNGELRGE